MYALYKVHLRWACIQRGSSLIKQSINTQMFSLSTMHAQLDLLLPSRLFSGWLLPSSSPIYVPPLLSISRFTVEIQTMFTLRILLKITCNLNVTGLYKGGKSSSLLLRNSSRWENGLGTFMFWGPFRGTAHTQKSWCQKEMLSLFRVHREWQGPVTSMKSHCSSLRSIKSKPTVSEIAATLPKLSPQLQMLQTGCTDIPAQRNMCFIAHSWWPLCHLPSSFPRSLGRCSYTWGKHISFCWAPTSFVTTFSVTHLWHIIFTANSHC